MFAWPATQEERRGDGSFCNSREAGFIVRLVKHLLELGCSPSDIGVVALYRAQASLVATQMKEVLKGGQNILVSTGLRCALGVCCCGAVHGSGLTELALCRCSGFVPGRREGGDHPVVRPHRRHRLHRLAAPHQRRHHSRQAPSLCRRLVIWMCVCVCVCVKFPV
jgi:hypothetical protein